MTTMSFPRSFRLLSFLSSLPSSLSLKNVPEDAEAAAVDCSEEYANTLHLGAPFSILTNVRLALKMRSGGKGLRGLHDLIAASASETAVRRRSDLFLCVVCLLSLLITLYLEIKHRLPGPAAGLRSSLMVPSEPRCYLQPRRFHLAG